MGQGSLLLLFSSGYAPTLRFRIGCAHLGQDQRGRIWGRRQAKIRGDVCGNRATIQEPSACEVTPTAPIQTPYHTQRHRSLRFHDRSSPPATIPIGTAPSRNEEM